ncbi:AAA family ATPase [Kitasatospora sp. NPDC087315]|uniref:AAA family ATPase n=1 Tax=Kitasatospora sp. NPDC087315 TaxID=3364069 RepID=UPI0038104548
MAATATGAPVNAGALIPHTLLGNQLRRALKQARPARIMVDGPSGSGQTWTALDLATGLATTTGLIGVIDTNGGASLRYAGEDGDGFDFGIIELTSFAPENLCMALYEFGTAGCDVVLVDSFSAFWSGSGGLLELVDAETAKADQAAARAKQPRPGSSAGWNAVRPRERMMTEALLAFPGHVIVTVGTVTETVLEETASGRAVPRRHGLKLDQRQGVEAPFDVALSLLPGTDHHAVVAKSRVRALDGQILKFGERPAREVGRQIAEWAVDGIDCAPLSEFYTTVYNQEATVADLERLRGRIADTRAHGMAAFNVMPRQGNGLAENHGDPIPLGVLAQRRLEAARAAETQARRFAPPAPPEASVPVPPPAPRPVSTTPVSDGDGGRERRPGRDGPTSIPEEIDTVGETEPARLALAAAVAILRRPDAWDTQLRVAEAWAHAIKTNVLDLSLLCEDGRMRVLRDLLQDRQAELKANMLFADTPA